MSEDVRRYDFTTRGMLEMENGRWVEIEAYDRLRARITELERELNPDPEAHLMGWEGDDE